MGTEIFMRLNLGDFINVNEVQRIKIGYLLDKTDQQQHLSALRHTCTISCEASWF